MPLKGREFAPPSSMQRKGTGESKAPLCFLFERKGKRPSLSRERKSARVPLPLKGMARRPLLFNFKRQQRRPGAPPLIPFQGKGRRPGGPPFAFKQGTAALPVCIQRERNLPSLFHAKQRNRAREGAPFMSHLNGRVSVPPLWFQKRGKATPPFDLQKREGGPSCLPLKGREFALPLP